MYSFSMFPIVALEEEDLACFLHEEIQKKKKNAQHTCSISRFPNLGRIGLARDSDLLLL